MVSSSRQCFYSPQIFNILTPHHRLWVLQSVKQQAIMTMNLVLSFAGVWAFVYVATHTTFQTQGAVRKSTDSNLFIWGKKDG